MRAGKKFAREMKKKHSRHSTPCMMMGPTNTHTLQKESRHQQHHTEPAGRVQKKYLCQEKKFRVIFLKNTCISLCHGVVKNNTYLYASLIFKIRSVATGKSKFRNKATFLMFPQLSCKVSSVLVVFVGCLSFGHELCVCVPSWLRC